MSSSICHAASAQANKPGLTNFVSQRDLRFARQNPTFPRNQPSRDACPHLGIRKHGNKKHCEVAADTDQAPLNGSSDEEWTGVKRESRLKSSSAGRMRLSLL